MVCNGKARKELQVHDIVALQRANNNVLFNALVLSPPFPVSRGELATFLFQKGRKTESAIRRKTFYHFTKYQYPLPKLFRALILQELFTLQLEDASCLWSNHHKSRPHKPKAGIDRSLATRSPWVLPPCLGEGRTRWIAQNCQQGAAGATSRSCHLYSWLTVGLCPGEGRGCRRLKMIKSGTRMCTEYFLLQKSDFQGYLFRVHNAMTLLERRMLKNCTVKWAWQLQVSAWRELLDGFISFNYTTGEKQHSLFKETKYSLF